MSFFIFLFHLVLSFEDLITQPLSPHLENLFDTTLVSDLPQLILPKRVSLK